jgi:nucleotide-binding universal stress UspA family protein
MPLVQKSLIWALDPFEENVTFRAQLMETLRKISEKQKLPVQPVYILNLAEESEGEPDIETLSPKQLKQTALKVINKTLETFRNIHFLRPKVLLEPHTALTTLVKCLTRFSQQSDVSAELIVVGTHARVGLPRLLLGSFTETLLLHSTVPILSVGPGCSLEALGRETQEEAKEDRILFATDFTIYSEKIYGRLLDFASKMHAHLTLFHVIPHSIEPILQTGSYLLSGGWVTAPEYVTQEDADTQLLAEKWAQLASSRGIKTKICISSEKHQTASLIIQQARLEQSHWIAMAAESGAAASAILGSITRQVVRNAPCPVWVVRPT